MARFCTLVNSAVRQSIWGMKEGCGRVSKRVRISLQYLALTGCKRGKICCFPNMVRGGVKLGREGERDKNSSVGRCVYKVCERLSLKRGLTGPLVDNLSTPHQLLRYRPEQLK